MRILAIRGARLASLDAPFEVDLAVEPLRSAGVFAIVGPTGAGKSSLLDALCLALFDTTPRLERTPRQRLDEESDEDLSGRDARTLVRRGAKDAYAEVDFVGVDGRTYRARWAVERGRTGRLRPTQLSLRDVASEKCISGTKGEVLAAIETRLGLGLAELRRAVLLPQGEVAAFLDAPSDERAMLLERLTGAEIFAEVSKVVHVRAADARRARENVEVTLGMLAVLEPEEIARLDDELVTLRIDAARAEERTAALVAQRDRHASLARLRLEERAAREAVAEVERQRGLAELTRDEVTLAERAEHAADALSEERNARETERDARARHAAEALAHARARAAVAPQAEGVEHIERERDELEVAQAATRRGQEQVLAEARARLDAIATTPADEVSALRARARLSTELSRAIERQHHAEASEKRARDEATHARELARTTAASATRLDARALELALDAMAQAARLDEARRASERLVVARSLEAHRACLVQGEPCPLCGSTAHPSSLAIAPLESEAGARLATITLALDRTRATLARVQASVTGLRRESASAEARERTATNVAARAGHDAAMLARDVRDLARALAIDAATTSAIEAALGPLSTEIEARARSIDTALAEERIARESLSRLEAATRAAQSDAERARATLAARLEAAARSHERAAERERALAESVARHAVALSAAEAGCALAVVRSERALEAASIGRADAERVLGVDRERIRRLRTELARLDRERASARARLEEREARRAEAELIVGQDMAPTGEELDGAIASARAARDDARRREAAVEGALAHDRVTRARADELRVASTRAAAEEARWSGLDALIGAADGKRFRAHAQSLTLERLVGFANAELAHLAPRFTLARAPMAGELALSVVDREAGYTRRTVQSLSGGESFLVSLALALGLAAMTAAEGGRGALRASSLFLDEGLGALDPASLEIALAALEALRASGRQIAIVTHVPQVAERFAARVEVIPRGAGRSDVRVLRA